MRGFKAFCEMKEQLATIGSPVRYFILLVSSWLHLPVESFHVGRLVRWVLTMNNIDTLPHQCVSFFFFHTETRVESGPWSNNAVLLYLRFFLTSLNPYLSPTRSVLIFSFCRKLFESWLKSRLWSFISRLI